MSTRATRGGGRLDHGWRYRGVCLAGLVLALLAGSCSDDNSPTAPPLLTPTALVALGWTHFEQGSAGAARGEFEAALAQAPTMGSAHLGRAWCLLVLAGAREDYQAAADAFASAIAHQETSAAAYAGRAASRLALGDGELAGAVADAGLVLAREPSFNFAHDSSFDSADVRRLLAGAEAGRGDYAAALAGLAPDYPLPVSPDDPGTWLVGGVQHASFAGAALAWLQEVDKAAGP